VTSGRRVLSTCGQPGVDAAIMSAMKPATQQHTPATDNPLSYAGYRLPPDVISYAFLLSSEKHACRGRDVA